MFTKSGPSIRYFLLTANAFLLLLPIGAVVFLRLWDKHLVRVTEERLIAESVAVAAAWRAHLAAHAPVTDAGRVAIDVPAARLAEGYEILPPSQDHSERASRGNDPGVASQFASELIGGAGATGSEVSILDDVGCVVSSSQPSLASWCVGTRPEVREALAGRYTAAVRRRSPDDVAGDTEGRPSGRVRVFTALPISAPDGTRGVVYMSRASSSPLEAVWTLRRTIIVALVGCLFIMVAISLFLSWAISRPVWAITRAAEAVARGEPRTGFRTTGLIPAEVHVLAGALERMTDQLDARARYVAEFATQVSHELKTPLTSIRGAVELVRDDWQHMEEQQRSRFLSNIEADVDRTLRLVQRLLQLARIEHSADEVDEIELRSFLTRLVERYGDRVELSFSKPPPMIAMNSDHLESAITNLVDNGLRYGGDRPVRVEASSGGDGRLVVKVRDRGPGISEGNRRRVFERFFTTERDRGGTGLGLAIVRAIAESRGGSVAFEAGSTGTTFTLVV